MKRRRSFVRATQDDTLEHLLLLAPDLLAKIPPALRRATLREGRRLIYKMLDRVGRPQKRSR